MKQEVEEFVQIEFLNTEAKKELVKKMLKKEMNIDLISELTGLTKEEIENLA